MRRREDLLDLVRARPDVGVLVVGGGINGVGVLRDLAAQGVGAVLVERSDFCSGTSAAPSRLIHGGLRYLETGEFALVRESVEERNRLLMNAPHLVVPIPVWVPLRGWWAGLARAPARFLGWARNPGAKGALVTKLGLVFYDWFGRHVGGVPRHRLVGGAAVRTAMPSISPGVKLVAEFYDARLVHPERLTLELVADAERDCADALALPYVSLVASEGGTVTLRDELTGETLAIRPRLVINTTGAWVDQVDQRMGVQHRLIGGTRGSHLVLRNPTLARELAERMLYYETQDHRICLAYCLTDELVLLGTTDIRTDDPDDCRCTDAEIEYLFAELRIAMPQIEVSREQIVFSYAGVRPLPAADGTVAGAISRDHAFKVLPADGTRPFDILTLVGGKWTTYRACAAQMADVILERLGRQRSIDTSTLSIGGGREGPADDAARAARAHRLATESGIDVRVVARLVERYGASAPRVCELVAASDSALVEGLPDYTVGEMIYMARHQRVGRLADVVLRRTLLAIEGRCTEVALRAIATTIGPELGWDASRTEREIADSQQLLRLRHGVEIGTVQPDSRTSGPTV